MKRAVILCLFLFLDATAGKCDPTVFPALQTLSRANSVQQNYGSNVTSLPDIYAKPPAINFSGISRIEQSLFGRSFENLDILTRLSRIEKNLFNTTYPNATKEQRIDNIISNFNQINKYPNISKGALSGMEAKIFHQNYPQNGPERRIERLEQQVFGAVQSGDLNTRYENLKIAINNYNVGKTAYYPTAVAPSGIRGILGNIGNAMMGGSMTGFTPSIDPFDNNFSAGYNNYNNNGYNILGSPSNPYNMGGHGAYRGYRSNHGYSDAYQDFNTGTGVTILD